MSVSSISEQSILKFVAILCNASKLLHEFIIFRLVFDSAHACMSQHGLFQLIGIHPHGGVNFDLPPKKA